MWSDQRPVHAEAPSQREAIEVVGPAELISKLGCTVDPCVLRVRVEVDVLKQHHLYK